MTAACHAWPITVSLPPMIHCLLRGTVFKCLDDRAMHTFIRSTQVQAAAVTRNVPDPDRVFPNAWWLPDGPNLSSHHYMRPIADIQAEVSLYFGEVRNIIT
jgi:hypothetical protein